jgi:hypothetical protein
LIFCNFFYLNIGLCPEPMRHEVPAARLVSTADEMGKHVALRARQAIVTKARHDLSKDTSFATA